mmetsp:Transcript_12109/g.25799  ORF Transcript_12109/g.25799 Transcript_12109/m.25799 type:complete len:88 (-) Transcript_12109:1082-1345(-)
MSTFYIRARVAEAEGYQKEHDGEGTMALVGCRAYNSQSDYFSLAATSSHFVFSLSFRHTMASSKTGTHDPPLPQKNFSAFYSFAFVN